MNRHVRAQQFIIPKEGSTPDECEDAVGVDAGALRFALADGATEAFDARRWAARLVERWVGAAQPPLTVAEFRPWLAEQGDWLRDAWDGRSLPWYAEEKRRAGSYAAFVGLQLVAGGRGVRWSAVALGDACLVQRRGAQLCAAMPVSSHEAFGSCPPLVPSHESLRETALARLVTAGGDARGGDVFLLMSDALAAWYFERLAKHDTAVARFDSLLAAAENDALAGLVRQERAAKRMKDDDVAAVRVAVERG
ncbi:MAG: hypothetical protein QOJ76_572 [Acidobacteriota bacterium]|jgi:hypothetical protein|nr:hypothetical protein [Acidobacteriota bacterium]